MRSLYIFKSVFVPAGLSSSQISGGICVILAAAFQIQITPFQDVGYGGLRVALSDALLPFILLYAGATLLMSRTYFPVWQRNGEAGIWLTPYILFAMLLAMSLSLFVPWLINAQKPSIWAIVNKYTGFYVLLAYFLVGAWLASNWDSRKIAFVFLYSFCGFSLFIMAVSFLMVIWPFDVPGLSVLGHYPWDGLMDNRNAYVIVPLLCMLFVECRKDVFRAVLPPWMRMFFWILLPVLALYNGSRTAWVLMIVILLGHMVLHMRYFLRHIFPALVLGGCLLGALLYANPGIAKYKNSQIQVMGRTMSTFSQVIKGEDYDIEQSFHKYDHDRWEALSEGWALYRKSNPILGIGLGEYKQYANAKYKDIKEYIITIHCSACWLLIETGLFGLASYSSFYILALFITYRRGFQRQADLQQMDVFYRSFHRAVFGALIILAGFSLMHEILYTRYLWFILGMLMVSSKLKRI